MSFDPYSWPGKLYFSDVNRPEAENLLQIEEHGTFIIRESSSQPGFSLSVREPDEADKPGIRHYLIIDLTRSEDNPEPGYQIGEQKFPDMPSLLNFYKTHLLENTHLIRPMQRHMPRVIAKFPFPGVESDLPFKKGEVLSILNKNDNNWWMAQNDFDRIGLIPANFVETISDDFDTSTISIPMRNQISLEESPSNKLNSDFRDSNSSSGSVVDDLPQSPQNTATAKRKLPAYAKVITDRNPSAYDKSNLRLRIGDIIKVIKTNPSGTWEGELKGKMGKFPVAYIQWLEEGRAPSNNNNRLS